MDQSSDFKKIEIFVSGRNLRDKDYFSKSDPYVIFFIKNNQNNQYIKVDRTETIKDNLNPNFVKSFIVDYIFEQKQECKFELYDDDGQNSDFLGSCETTIGKIMGAQKQISILDIKLKNSNQTQGKLVIRGDTLKDSNEFVFMKISGIKLMNTDGWFDKSDPLLRISKIRSDKTMQKIFESEHIMDNLNPNWKPFELPVGRLCDADHNQLFKIEVWDWEKNGKYQFIGEKDLSLNQIKGQKEFDLYNHKSKHPGKIKFDQFQIIIKPTFLDYIRGGLQLNLILAIDFTGSNGIPTAPSSLHYMNPQFMNQYQQAIVTVGEILLAYDYDQKIPSYGFGAKVRFPNLRSNETMHCFPLSGNPANVECFGLQNMLELYNYALHNVELSGPTYFGPIINESVKIAQMIKTQEQDIYTILLILTDGEIHDMNQTKNLIVSASNLPLSIIIVGIGQADFGNMDVLDGDSGLTDEQGRKGTRDLVQFVPYRNFNGNPAALARHVLAEIPDQVVKYNQMIGKKPNNPIQVDVNQLGFSSVKPPLGQQPPGQQFPGQQPPGQQFPGQQPPGQYPPSAQIPPQGYNLPPQNIQPTGAMNQSQSYGSTPGQQNPYWQQPQQAAPYQQAYPQMNQSHGMPNLMNSKPGPYGNQQTQYHP